MGGGEDVGGAKDDEIMKGSGARVKASGVEDSRKTLRFPVTLPHYRWRLATLKPLVRYGTSAITRSD